MLLNAGTAIETTQVLLVPYEAKHVLTYHGWMQEEEILFATASEPLSLPQEYEMQKSWRKDPDKLTFIVCRARHAPSADSVTALDDSERSMIGDVNLFLTISDEDNETIVGELEVMIAAKSARSEGRGKASLIAFMKYIMIHQEEIIKEFLGERKVDLHRLGFLRARIGEDNKQSLALFQTLDFKICSEKANVFGELELRTTGELVEFVNQCTQKHHLSGYRELKYEAQALLQVESTSVPVMAG